MRPIKIDDDVMQVLEAARHVGHNLYLQGQLEPQLYRKVNKVLEAIGFKWNRGQKAHITAEVSEDVVQAILDTGFYSNVKQDLGQFDTPPDVVAQVLALAGDLVGAHVLEPSAGIGNLAGPADDAGAAVWCYEIDAQRCEKLFDRLGREDVGGIINADFLSVDPADAGEPFDVVLMNPPFAGQSDIDHVLHAMRFLKPGGKLVAVMSSGTMFRENKKAVDFRRYMGEHSGHFCNLPAGAFSSSGTEVRACICVMVA